MERDGLQRRSALGRISSAMVRPSAWLIGVAMLLGSAPASAGQWVYGTVDVVEDYGGYDGGAWGVLITLTNPVWGAGDGGPAGATQCYGRFSIVAGQQGLNEHMVDRMFSILLTAAATHEPVALFVDTSVGPNCKVIIASYGRT